jgi:ribosomal protein L7Ae-like RNA K-turn-binding protein
MRAFIAWRGRLPLSAEDRHDRIEELLSLLGLARRAGVLLVGQDQVFRARAKGGLFVIASEDCSPNVWRKIGASGDGKTTGRMLCGVGRDEMGRHMGVRSAQIAAVPINSGFAKKITLLLRQEGSDIDE